MVAVKEYLREKAKFLSPGTGIKNPNALLAVLDEHLQDTPVEPRPSSPLDDRFSSLVDFAIYRSYNEVKLESPRVFDDLFTLLSRAMRW
ncbi:hypothetical protein ACEPAH_8585 [Sanghuangporus vaninii]